MIFSMGQDYHRMYEPIFYGWKKDFTHYSDHPDLQKAKDVWHLAYDDEDGGLFDIWRVSRDPRHLYEHPTQKPTKLIKRALINNSRRGDIVLDFFGGSGSTLLACEELGRRARILELDPKFIEVIIGRWEKMTGNKAVKI